MPTNLIPVTLGVQWAWQPNNQICPTCTSPNAGGLSCVRFPQGAKIWSIAWQSSVKVPLHEVLIHLVASENPLVLGTGLLSTHHVGNLLPTTHSRDIHLVAPMLVPANWYVWLYADGSGSPHGAPVEVQATLYIEPTQVTLP